MNGKLAFKGSEDRETQRSILDPAIDSGTAFRAAIGRFDEAGFTIRLFQRSTAHHYLTVRAHNRARTIRRVLLNRDLLLDGHF